MEITSSLHENLKKVLPDGTLSIQQIPNTPIKLWLVSPDNMHNRKFSSHEVLKILQQPPYWSFCWASGSALCQRILQFPSLVMGKKVLDFGAGSGCVAIAAKLAGAKEVTVCDLDQAAIKACEANALLNQVELHYLDNLLETDDYYDLIVAADILYDRDNFSWLAILRQKASQVLVADSRVKNFSHCDYQLLATMSAETIPDLLEPNEFREVKLYQSI